MIAFNADADLLCGVVLLVSMGDYGYVLPTVFEDAPLQLSLSRCASTNRGNGLAADCKETRGIPLPNSLHSITPGLKIPRISVENSYQDSELQKPKDSAVLRNNLSFSKTSRSDWNNSRKSSDFDADQDERKSLRNPNVYLDVSDFDIDSARNSSENFPFQSEGLFTKRPLPELPYNEDFEGSVLETGHGILRSKKVLITFIIVFFAFSTMVFGGLCMTHHPDCAFAGTTTTNATLSSYSTIDVTTETNSTVTTSEPTSTDGSTTDSETFNSSTTTSLKSTDYVTC